MRSALIIFCLLLGNGVTEVTAQEVFQRAMEWYDQRAQQQSDSLHVQSTAIVNAISSFRESLEKEKQTEEAAIYLLKAYYYKGMYADSSENLQKATYDQARKLGEKLTKRFPDSVPVKFWYSANLGRWAVVNGVWKAAKNGTVKELRKISQQIINEDPEYQGGGGFRILAQVHFYTPSIPLIMGWPSTDKALELIKRAVEVDPNHPANRLLYAEILLDLDQIELAKIHLRYLQQMNPRSNFLMEDKFAKHRARILARKYEIKDLLSNSENAS